MAFIVLGSVGSALGAALTTAGLTTIGGAITAGSAALGGSIVGGSAAAGALGAGATIGSTLAAPIGAVTGGIGSLMGGAGGAAAGGGSAAAQAASGIASASSAAPVAGSGGFIPGSMIANMGGSLAGAVPASSGTGIAGGSVFAGGTSAALPTTGSVFMGASAPSLMSEAGTELAKEGLQMAASPQEGQAPRASGGGPRPQSPYTRQEEESGFFSNPFASFAEGGLTTLKGGGIAMRDGQYVIPADVVSAIGNGSSKAGAKFLEQAFNYYMENGPPQGVQPPQRAGSLAGQRMAERTKRQSV